MLDQEQITTPQSTTPLDGPAPPVTPGGASPEMLAKKPKEPRKLQAPLFGIPAPARDVVLHEVGIAAKIAIALSKPQPLDVKLPISDGPPQTSEVDQRGRIASMAASVAAGVANAPPTTLTPLESVFAQHELRVLKSGNVAARPNKNSPWEVVSPEYAKWLTEGRAKLHKKLEVEEVGRFRSHGLQALRESVWREMSDEDWNGISSLSKYGHQTLPELEALGHKLMEGDKDPYFEKRRELFVTEIAPHWITRASTTVSSLMRTNSGYDPNAEEATTSSGGNMLQSVGRPPSSSRRVISDEEFAQNERRIRANLLFTERVNQLRSTAPKPGSTLADAQRNFEARYNLDGVTPLHDSLGVAHGPIVDLLKVSIAHLNAFGESGEGGGRVYNPATPGDRRAIIAQAAQYALDLGYLPGDRTGENRNDLVSTLRLGLSGLVPNSMPPAGAQQAPASGQAPPAQPPAQPPAAGPTPSPLEPITLTLEQIQSLIDSSPSLKTADDVRRVMREQGRELIQETKSGPKTTIGTHYRDL